MTISQRSQILLAGVVGFTLGAGALVVLEPSDERTEHEPNLCELDGGRWCEPCGDVGGPACPAGDAGWLCCNAATGVCVASSLTECGEGTLGWCSNYTEDASGSATCHD